MTIGLYGLVAFAVIFCGGMLGLLIGKVMHEGYRDDATQKIVQTATGMISLLAALVLGLLVATAKNKFDTNNKQTEEFAANLMLLDRELVNYGPEVDDIKHLLREFTVAKIATTWPQIGGHQPAEDPPAWQLLERVQGKLRSLAPQSEPQRSIVTSALQITANLTKTSWLETAEETDHVPHSFLLVLLVWLSVLFLSFGLFAPRNALVAVALLVCGLSIAGAVVLIVDMDAPFEGFIAVSAQPMQNALAKMSGP
jgi:hypothetical protein